MLNNHIFQVVFTLSATRSGIFAALFVLACARVAGAEDNDRLLHIQNHLTKLGVDLFTTHVSIPETARITDDDLSQLLEFSYVDGLSMSCRTVTSEGIITYLSKAEGLQYVALEGAAVTDDVIGALARFDSLTHLSLSGPFRGTGLRPLANGGVRNTLVSLRLRTEPTPRPDHYIGLAFGLKPSALTEIGNLHMLRELD